MSLNIAKYTSSMWSGIQDQSTQNAVADLAQKLALLARDSQFGLCNVGSIIMTTEPACPPGWELVAEFVDRVPLGVDNSANDVGETTGSMTHQHTIATEESPTTGSTNIDAHTHVEAAHSHTVSAGGTTINTGDGTTGTAFVIDSVTGATGSTSPGSTSGATTTAHAHTVPAHNHTGDTGTTDATPASVKVLFCRRVT